MSTVLYKSETMRQLMRMVDRVSPSSANVLILGEVGTGQELIATKIHELSNRKLKPFVSLNCGALRETLMESELFGHEKGSFTGAYSRKIGLMEVANGGTILLKEVDQLSPGLQAKLLRFLQEGEIYRVGGKDPIRCDVRVITSTHQELDKQVLKGEFREDLFYRLNTIMLHIAPLRRRKEDVLELARHFCQKTFSVETIKALENYPWPGNIRELKNVCERLNILVDSQTVQIGDLPEHIINPDSNTINHDPYDPSMTLHELEKQYIVKALAHYDGNKTQAANALGITIKTLYNKLHEYGMFEQYAVKTKIKEDTNVGSQS